jgi:branched-chain amino acid transport system permease protein
MPLMALFAILSLALVALICWRLTSSPWGRLLKAIRDDETVIAGLGKNVRLAEATAFAFSCGFTAFAGAIYAAHMSYIDPSVASLDNSILMLSMVIVGVTGNFVGPLVGAFVLVLLPEVLRFMSLPPSLAANARLMLYGALLVIMVHRRPQGLAGVYRLE